MNEYKIALCIVCIISFILVTIFIWIVRCFIDKIERLEDKIRRFDMINDMNDGKLERLENDIYALMDRVKELESDHNTTDSISIKELQKIIVNDNERGGVIELHW
jgi:predicted nuclease with TOPRIM domain